MSSVSKQEQLRRLMREQKAKSSADQKRIEHPLARYNTLGQLSCVLCSVPVKSELLWTTHLKSSRHRETVLALKSQQASATAAAAVTTTDSVGAGELSTRKRSLDQVSYNSSSPDPPETKKQKTSAPKSSKKVKNNLSTISTSDDSSEVLPSDFFDSGVRPQRPGEELGEVPSDDDETLPAVAPPTDEGSTVRTASDSSSESADKKKAKSNKELPEGFFDDPHLDAKARKVEYKDPITEEWEKFKKSIQKEDEVSEALLLEGDEETMEQRERGELNEQVSCYTKAEQLRQTQEKLQQQRLARSEGGRGEGGEGVTVVEGGGSGEDDELDFDEFFSWRAKST